MPFPNFFIIGAANSGTTSLYNYLGQHPDIYMSPYKEPNFFTWDRDYFPKGPGDAERRKERHVTDPDCYRALFDGVSTETAIGEATAISLYVPGVAERIHAQAPDAKLIAILRDPAERALSGYAHMINWRLEWHRSFAAALAAEDMRIREGWHPFWFYRDRGFYFRQLERYLAVFDSSQLKVVFYSDLKADAARVVRELCRFLEVDEDFQPETSVRHNPSSLPRSRRLHDFLHRGGLVRRAIRPVVRTFLGPERRHRIWSALYHGNWQPARQSQRIRRDLIEGYRDDILKLQDLLDRDLSVWLETNPRKARR